MAAVVDQTPTKAEATSTMFPAAQDQSVPPTVDYSSIRAKVMVNWSVLYLGPYFLYIWDHILKYHT